MISSVPGPEYAPLSTSVCPPDCSYQVRVSAKLPICFGKRLAKFISVTGSFCFALSADEGSARTEKIATANAAQRMKRLRIGGAGFLLAFPSLDWAESAGAGLFSFRLASRMKIKIATRNRQLPMA